MGPILLICPTQDHMVDAIVRELETRGGTPYLITATSLRDASFLLQHETSSLGLTSEIGMRGQWSVRLDELQGLYAPYHYMPILAEDPDTDSDAVFASTEYTSAVGLLTHQLGCTVINRLRPELWAYTVLDAFALGRLARGPFLGERARIPTVPTALVGAASVPDRFRGDGELSIWPFTYQGALSIDDRASKGLEEATTLMPLRVRSYSRGATIVDVYVVGTSCYVSDEHGSRSRGVDTSPLALSARICEGLGLVFGRARWVVENGQCLLSDVNVVPSVPSDDLGLIRVLASALAVELLR